MKPRTRFLRVWGLAVTAPLLAASGTVDAYYMTRHLTSNVNDSQSQVVVLQGTSWINSFFNPTKPTNRWELAIAVFDDVRTVGYRFPQCCPFTDPTGALYSLTGVYSGITFAVPLYVPTGQTTPTRMVDTADSATDGVYNYLVSTSQGDVVRTDRNFQNPVVLFNIPGAGFDGITYDRKTGTLWLSGFTNSLVRNYDMGGNLLSQFSTGHVSNNALAYETATDTLWLLKMLSLDTSRTDNFLEQWSKTGQLLQTIPGMPVIFGGEMSISDHTPPVIAGMPPAGCKIWPPNNKMVFAAHVTATDVGSGFGLKGLQVSGTSNEPPPGPGNPDIEIVPDGSGGFIVKLRATRLGTGSGRVYTLTATATDVAGNTASVTSTCAVPHSQGQ